MVGQGCGFEQPLRHADAPVFRVAGHHPVAEEFVGIRKRRLRDRELRLAAIRLDEVQPKLVILE